MMVDDAVIAFLIGAVLTCAQSLLLVAILNKAGFAGGWMMAGLAPVVALAGQSYFVFQGTLTPSEAVLLFAALWLLPYLILALKSWPVAAKHVLRPET